MSYNERLIQQFRIKTEEFWPHYKSIGINALLIKENEHWKINTCTMALSPISVPTTNIKWLMETDRFILVEETKNIDDFGNILQSALEGLIEINNKEYEIFDNEADKHIRMSDGLIDSGIIYGAGSKCYSIFIEPKPSMNRIMGDTHDEFQEALKINVPPFGNIHELNHVFFIMGNHFSITEGLPFIFIHAPLPLLISDNTKFLKDGLHIEIELIKGLNKSKIQLNYVFITNEIGNNRGVIPDVFSDSSPTPSIIHLETTIDWARLRFQIITCNLFLIYDGQFISEKTLYNPYYQSENKGIKVLQILFKNLEDRYMKQLSGVKPNQFENAIAILFGFCNFKVIPLGEISQFSDAPDIIAIDIYNQIGIVVEASTLEFLDKEKKLTKFITRCEILKKHLDDIEIIPVFCTSLEGSKLVHPEIEEAKKHNIIILSREDLIDLFELAKKNVPNEDVIEFIKSRSPSNKVWSGLTSR